MIAQGSDDSDRAGGISRRDGLNKSAHSGSAVLLVANYPSDVGYAWWLMEAFWATIASDMAESGRKCLLAYPKINVVPQVVRQAPIEVMEWQVRPRTLGEALRGAVSMRKLGISSVYLTDWPGYSYVYLLWRLAGVRRIVLHDHTPGDRPAIHGPRAWFKSLIHWFRWLSCDSYVGVSDYIRRRFTENGRVPADRCFVVRNGIRTFACEGVDRTEIRTRLGVPASAVLVVLVSRATYYKGWDFAVKCAASLLAQVRTDEEVHFVFCGDGPDLDDFRRLAQSLAVSERCHFLGQRDDVREILCGADIAFHPSRGEALSLATLEFMCAGLPVVLPDRPSVSGVLHDGIDGVVYPAEQIVPAAQAIIELARDPEKRRRVGLAASHTVASNYRLEDTLRDIQQVVTARL